MDSDALAVLVRRAFGTSLPVHCERTPDGVSSQVYRLVRGSETFYLRVAEEADENLETDAELHRRLLALGVRVPRMVFVEPYDAAIGRSVAITSEVPGVPLAAAGCPPEVALAVAAEAGEDLAVINHVTVDGFGWVRRSGQGWPLRAEHTSYLPFLTSYLPVGWPGPLGSLLPGDILTEVEARSAAPSRRSIWATSIFTTRSRCQTASCLPCSRATDGWRSRRTSGRSAGARSSSVCANCADG